MRHSIPESTFHPFGAASSHLGVLSGNMALIAIYAASKDRFWEMNDALFEIAGQKKAFNTKDLAKKTGLDVGGLSKALRDPNIQLKLQRDIMEGLKFGITGTPAFVIDGKVYLGQLPPEIIKKAIE